MSSTRFHSLQTTVLNGNGNPQGADTSITNKDSPVKRFDVILADVLEENSPSTKPGELITLKTIPLDGTKSYTLQIRLQTQQGGSPLPTPQPSPIESTLFSLLKRNVYNFVKNTNTLISALDKVTKTHSVIQGVVSSFKAAIELELAWPKHDDKTIALSLTMCNMMLAFTKLRAVADPDRSDKDPLKGFKDVNAIADSIKLCAKVCDSYRKQSQQHVLDKSFMQQWQGKFHEVALKFATHKTNILSDTSIQAFVGIAASDALIAMEADMEKLTGNISEFVKVAFGVNSSEEGVSLPGVHKDVEQVLADNDYFDKKFKVAMQWQADETRMSITAHKRIIDTLESGHERIIDSDIRKVWTQNRKDWKDGVEAKSLVMALCDYFESGGGAGNLVSEDKWDLQCIRDVLGPQAKQPSVKESDLSVLITVSEVNAFTAARPRAWSLLRWISYWTSQYGFEMTLQWYLHRIYNVMVEIQDPSTGNLNSDNSTQGNSDNSTQAKKTRICVESISKAMGFLSKLRDDKQRGGNINWEDDYRFCKFKNDVLKENEEQMDQSLRMLNYKLDTQIKLIIVAEEDRPEKYNLPLILHLGIKARNILKQVGNLSTQDLETLDAIVNSLLILAPSSELQAKSQNQNKRDFLSGLCSALYQIRSTTSENTNPGARVPPPLEEQNNVHTLPVSGEAAETSKSPN